ncbi:MAG: hypothetical protein A4S09_06205 [Proteobacteria bacterium SG_bin7]|nr:MAG: hypothetical protein A4S09_06205 [Proteobacteria bacterium SG_bin7]
MIRILVLLLVSYFNCLANAETICGTGTAYKMDYKYCIHKNQNSQDVLHYLHGHGGSEKNWGEQEVNKNIRKHWTAAGKEVPNVIAFSFGTKWLLTEVPQSGGVSRYYAYINKILPDLEAKLGSFTGRRMLMGESMGGINSTLIMERAGNLFERVAINCPAITAIGPHASDREVEAYIQRHQPYVSRFYVMYMQQWGQQEFPTQADWEHHAPLDVGRTSPVLPQNIYVSCGNKDQFGFIEGAEKFAEIAASRGRNVIWVPIEGGGHCSINSKAVSEFLMP